MSDSAAQAPYTSDADNALVIFAGRFGSGKTETALTFARTLARDTASEPVILIDLDIVTPYFRSREMAEAFREYGVEVVSPAVIGQHLDTPAITPQILGAIQQEQRPTVLDVGGDKQGARALGQFSAAINQRGYQMHFVVNPYRPFTDTVAGLTSAIAEIEESARLKVTSLVSNPNLISETTLQDIVRGHELVEGFAQTIGLPIAFICIERRWAAVMGLNGSSGAGPVQFSQPVLVLERSFVQPWE
jgi:hypothetical protein